MATDTLKLGQLIGGDQHRDAIHVAVAPVLAVEWLSPGDHVGLVGVDHEQVERKKQGEGAIGIVDPFLTTRVPPGQRFWMFLYPYTITSLRHDWTHPAFAGASTVSAASESESWLREFAKEIDVSYNTLMAAIEAREKTGDYYVFNGHDTPDACYRKLGDMWKHYEIVTGTKVEDHKQVVFSCAC